MDRADADVVGHRARVDLLGAVGGQADERVGPGDCARLGDRAVVLADVHAVGAGRGDEVGPIVEDEQRASDLAPLARDGGSGEDLLVGRVLAAQLEDVDAAAQRGREHGLQRAPAGRGVADQVQARR